MPGSASGMPSASRIMASTPPKQQSYAVGVPMVIHASRSRPAPMSIMRLSSVVWRPSSPWNSVNTAFPSSSPRTKYSRDGPNEPPPAHTSSTNTISSGAMPNGPVSMP